MPGLVPVSEHTGGGPCTRPRQSAVGFPVPLHSKERSDLRVEGFWANQWLDLVVVVVVASGQWGGTTRRQRKETGWLA